MEPRCGSPSLERLGARVVESTIPAARADMWPLFLHEAAQSHRETFPSRADEYADTIRPKLEAAQRVAADDVSTAYGALEAWRAYEPDVDLYVSPGFAIELPPRMPTSSRSGCRCRRSCAGST